MASRILSAAAGMALLHAAQAMPAASSTSKASATSSSSSSSAAQSPATTAGPSLTDSAIPMGGALTPGFTYGYTTISGKAYPIIGGQLDGGYHFTGSGYSVTGGAGGALSNCYTTIEGQLYPVACYTAHEQDTELFTSNGMTFYDGGLPGATSDVVFTGQFPGPQTLTAGGDVGVPGTLFVGGIASPYITPALNPGETARGGLGGSGTALIGGATFGGDAGGTFATAPAKTSGNIGGVGSAGYGPASGQGTLGGSYNNGTPVGCAGLNVNGAGYTSCVTFAKRTAEPAVATAA